MSNITGADVAQAALRWVGREYNPGLEAQCMAFVRRVLRDASHPLAEVVTANPVDGHWTGRDLASSLAGRDLGAMFVKTTELQAGDIVFFNDTYQTGFPAGTITHVGIALGPLDIVHRPTVARPVERSEYSGYSASKFRCGLRPTATTAAPRPATDPEPPRLAAHAPVFLNGKQVGPALLQDGQSYLTTLTVAALLGLSVEWDAKAKVVRLSK